MPRRYGPSFALLGFASLVHGCSLMGLDDFGVTPCKSNGDCLNATPQLQPGKGACGSAVCQEGLCKWHENQEICNGQDDDCDGIIDNGLFMTAQKGTATAVPPIDYSAATSSKRTFVAVAAGGESQGFILDGEVKQELLRYESSLGPALCPGSTTSCNFAEVALAADTQHLVVASINTLGCADGQVRVGLGDISGSPFDVWLGKALGSPSEDPSNIEPGVDVDMDDRGCTGKSNGVDAAGTPLRGATHPAVATLGTEPNGEGALVLWLAASAKSPDTSSDSVAVEALGLVVPADQPVWLNGADKGVPRELGRTTARSAPAVLALKSDSGSGQYLVAFPSLGDEGLGIRLLSVRIENKQLSFESIAFLGVGVADQVSLALGNPHSAEVGVSWRCGSGADAQLCFTVVSTAGARLFGEKVLTIPTPAPRITAPLIYRQKGFAEGDPTGGWFLSWINDVGQDLQTAQVARIREGTLQMVGSAPLRAAGIPVLYPAAAAANDDGDDDDDWSVSYALIQPATTGASHLETVPLWCQ